MLRRLYVGRQIDPSLARVLFINCLLISGLPSSKWDISGILSKYKRNISLSFLFFYYLRDEGYAVQYFTADFLDGRGGFRRRKYLMP